MVATEPSSGGADDPRPVPERGLTLAQQERALFVADHGRGMGALDVLDGAPHRAPAVRWVLQHSTLPHFRVVAAMQLCAWGDPDALRLVDEWARFPDDTPPVEQTWFQDPLSGCDNGFELLCHGVGTTGRSAEAATVRADRITALGSLTRVATRHYVGRALPRAVDDLQVTWADLGDDLDAAVHDALDRLARRERSTCDLPFQAAVLVGVMAALRDADGARAAEVLLRQDLTDRAARELLVALGRCEGRDSQALLAEVDAAGGVRAEWAREALRLRSHPYRRPAASEDPPPVR